MTLVADDLDTIRAALGEAAGRVARLFETLPDGSARVPGMDWTVSEVGAHMAAAFRGCADATRGDFGLISPYIPDNSVFVERLRTVTAGTLHMEPERSPVALAALVTRRVEEFLAATAGWPGPDRQLVAWGRKPWLGLGFRGLFHNP